MYLALLNDEQKKLFLDLAVVLASADGGYSEEEKSVIAGYCQEIQIDLIEECPRKSIEEIINQLNTMCTEREKKIVIFESVGLAISDGIYHVTEREMIKNMIEKLNLKKEFGNECENMIKKYMEFQNKINKLIIE